MQVLVGNAVPMVVFMMCLQISFQDHGSPESFQTNTEVTIRVKDADDQNPVFTKPVYHANVTESAQISVSVPNLLPKPRISNEETITVKTEHYDTL